MNPQIGFLLNKSLESLRNSNLESAELYLKQALRLQPSNPHVLRLLGVISAQRRQYSNALEYLKNSLKALPKNALALSNLGNVYLELGEYSNALDAYDKSIKIDSKYEEAWSNKGNVLSELKRYQEAIDHHDKALSLKPDYAEGWSNKGNVLNKLKRFDDAIAHFDKALSLKPDYAEGWSNKGNLLSELKQFDDAIAHFDKALSLMPDYSEGWLNKAMLNLFLKQYQTGWKDYDWRLKKKDFQLSLAIDGMALWNGLSCKHLLIFSEQGVGDIIFYASMLGIIKNRVGNITISIDIRLLPILSRSFPGVVFIDKDAPLDATLYDAQIPFGSLPVVMNMHPDMDGRRVPYLIANDELTKTLKNNPSPKKQLRCGVAWKSKNQKIGSDKSILLSDLNEIFQIDGYEFVNLQYGDTQEEIKDLENNYGAQLTTIDGIDLFENIDGLLSIIQTCDLIVTTSNVTAHLSGALGKTTFLLTPYSTGRLWYWHEEAISSWYPSISLFTQSKNFEWNGAIKNIAAILKR